MKNNTKKFLATSLAFFMAFYSVPVNALAAIYERENLTENSLEISEGYEAGEQEYPNQVFPVVVPETHQVTLLEEIPDVLTYEGFLAFMESLLYEPRREVPKPLENVEMSTTSPFERTSPLDMLERALPSENGISRFASFNPQFSLWEPPYDENWNIILPLPLPYGNTVRTHTHSNVSISNIYAAYRAVENLMTHGREELISTLSEYIQNRGRREINQILIALEVYNQFVEFHGESDLTEWVWQDIQHNIFEGRYVPPSNINLLVSFSIPHSIFEIAEFSSWGPWGSEIFPAIERIEAFLRFQPSAGLGFSLWDFFSEVNPTNFWNNANIDEWGRPIPTIPNLTPNNLYLALNGFMNAVGEYRSEITFNTHLRLNTFYLNTTNNLKDILSDYISYQDFYWENWNGDIHFGSGYDISPNIRIFESSLQSFLPEVASVIFSQDRGSFFSSLLWSNASSFMWALWLPHYYLFIEEYREDIDLEKMYELSNELIYAIDNSDDVSSEEAEELKYELQNIINNINATLSAPLTVASVGGLLNSIDFSILPDYSVDLLNTISSLHPIIHIGPNIVIAIDSLLREVIVLLENEIALLSVNQNSRIGIIRDELLALFPVDSSGALYIPQRHILTSELREFLSILTVLLADGFILDNIYNQLMNPLQDVNGVVRRHGLRQINSQLSVWFWNMDWWNNH
ncbi:MAG: hypothetical protein FWF57_04280 [Defluviitaleaceae bacterium]|nr:hypothetical protein [Defluviitaleaceae bacterium]